MGRELFAVVLALGLIAGPQFERSDDGAVAVRPSILALQAPDTVYEIVLTGITCKGCRREVTDLLTKLENVKAVEVDVATEKATVTMKGSAKLERAALDKALKGTKFGVVSMTEKKAPESRPHG